jgi:2-dehydropantoate 2-reductase
MHIAILGTGAIGSALAFQLSKAGHRVTTIARGKRLEQLRRAGAVVLRSGARAEVEVLERLDRAVPYDLVVVTVLAPQVPAILEDVRQSAARQVMFMFNTFESLEPLKAAVGAGRFRCGFPMGIFGYLVDGELQFQVGAGTTMDDPAWAEVFTAAGVPTVTSDDMQGWLRAHAAMVIPLMSIGVKVLARSAGISWAEARLAAAAFDEGFQAVRALGHRITPALVNVLALLPRFVTVPMFWALSRSRMLRELGKLGDHEPKMLIDQIARAWKPTPALKAIRPR